MVGIRQWIANICICATHDTVHKHSILFKMVCGIPKMSSVFLLFVLLAFFPHSVFFFMFVGSSFILNVTVCANASIDVHGQITHFFASHFGSVCSNSWWPISLACAEPLSFRFFLQVDCARHCSLPWIEINCYPVRSVRVIVNCVSFIWIRSSPFLQYDFIELTWMAFLWISSRTWQQFRNSEFRHTFSIHFQITLWHKPFW